MGQDTIFVSLPLAECRQRIAQAVMEGSVTGECVDRHVIQSPDRRLCVAVDVYEKHYWRAGNRLTLTVTVDNLQGATRVHCVGGGGGEGLFRFDWGASEDFAYVALEALRPYQINP